MMNYIRLTMKRIPEKLRWVRLALFPRRAEKYLKKRKPRTARPTRGI